MTIRRAKSNPCAQKQDDYGIFFGPELGIKDGKLGLPKGVVTGVQLEAVLRGFPRCRAFTDFDDLPIPFRAVATDLVTGKAVVFSEGELASVMRASMSVPGAVAPAEYGGMMLVDGMLTSNLPVQVARAMGADIIIAVNVGTPLLKRDELTGILGVTGQMLSILTEQNVEASIASMKPTDILISPELGGFSTGDFDHLPQIAPRGEEAARQVAERLRPLALPPAEYAALREKQKSHRCRTRDRSTRSASWSCSASTRKTAQAVMETESGQPIDQKVLDADMRRLYGTGDFERVDYRFLEEPGKRVLAVDAVEKAGAPITCAWAWGYPAISVATRSSMPSPVIARPGSIRSAPSGAPTLRSAAPPTCRPSSTSRSMRRASSSSIRPRPSGGARRSFIRATIALHSTTSILRGRRGRRHPIWPVWRVPGRHRARPTQTGARHRPANFRSASVAHFAGGVYGTADARSGGQCAFPALRLECRVQRLRLDRPARRSAAATSNGTARAWLPIPSASTRSIFPSKSAARLAPIRCHSTICSNGADSCSNPATPPASCWDKTCGIARAMYYRRILQGTLFEGAYGGFSLEAGKVDEPLVAGQSGR